MPMFDPPLLPATLPTPVEIRLTAERVKIDAGESMGMTGLHYLRPLGDTAYGGVSVFGATAGNRGGFFGWGVSGGFRARHRDWLAEAGLFVGGGGGSPAWVGGGLMWRPHAGLSYRWGDFEFGAGVAEVRFPSGIVDSRHLFLQASWSGQALFGPPGGHAGTAEVPWSGMALPTEVTAQVGSYRPRSGSLRRDGTGPAAALHHGGAVWRRALGPPSGALQPYGFLSTAGAMSREYAGYAELIGGVGADWALPFAPALRLRAEAGVGSGGAGALADTGGGLLRKGSVGLVFDPGSALRVAAMVGRAGSAGPFDVSERRIEIGVRGFDVVPGGAVAASAAPPWRWEPWSLAAGVNHYARAPRADGSHSGFGVSWLRLERELDPHWRLLGQAGIGVSGNAGGVATGQLGIGWLAAPVAGGWRFGAEASVGVVGGGDVKVGNGLVGQAQLQARCALTPAWSLRADLGRLQGRETGLSGPMAGLSVVYAFSRPQGR